MKTKTTDTVIFRTLLIALGISLASFLSAAPLLHYELNEGTGTTAFDTGDAPAANGTLTGSGSGWVVDSPSGTGSSYSVAGSSGSSYIDSGTVTKLQGLGDFTISFWMKLSGADVNDRIFSTRGTTSGASIGYLDIIATSADVNNMVLRFEMSPGSTGFSAFSPTFDATDWVFVSIIRDESAGEIQYFLGDTTASSALVDGGVTTGMAAGSNQINQNSGPMRIGSTAASPSNRSPDGFLSDFRFYESALTENEVNGIRTAAIPEPAAGVALGLAALAFVCVRLRRSGRAARV